MIARHILFFYLILLSTLGVTQGLKPIPPGLVFGEITQLEISNDGKYFVSYGLDGYLRLWEMASGRFIKNIERDTSINFIKFHPKLDYTLIKGKFGVIELVNLKSNITQEIVDLSGTLRSMEINPITGDLWVAVNEPTSIYSMQWNGQKYMKKKECRVKNISDLYELKVSLDGSSIALLHSKGIDFINSSGKVIYNLTPNGYYEIVDKPRGFPSRFLSGEFEADIVTLSVYDPEKANPAFSIGDVKGSVLIVFPFDSSLNYIYEPQTLEWFAKKTEAGEYKLTLEPRKSNRDPVNEIVTASFDNLITLEKWKSSYSGYFFSVRMYDRITSNSVFLRNTGRGACKLFGKQLLMAGEKITLYDIENSSVIYTLSGSVDILNAEFADDRLFIWQNDKVIYWDLTKGIQNYIKHKVLREEYYSDPVTTVSSNGNYLALESNTTAAYGIYNVESRKVIRTISDNYGRENVVFNPVLSQFLTSNQHTGNYLFNLESDSPILEIIQGGNPIFSPDGKLILFTTGKGMHIYSTLNGKFVKKIDIDHDIKLAKCTLNGSAIIISNENKLELLDYDKGVITESFVTESPISQLTVSNDSTTIVTGHTNGKIMIWELPQLNLIATIDAHTSPIRSLSTSKKGEFIVSTDENGAVAIWDLQNHSKLADIYISRDSWVITSIKNLFDGSTNNLSQLYFVKDLETIEFEQLKDRYYEPGLLSKILGYSKELLRESRGMEDIDLFPDFNLTHPNENNGLLGIELRNQGGGIGRVVVTINGKEATSNALGSNFDPDGETATAEFHVAGHPYLKSGEVNHIEVNVFNKEEYLSSRGKTIFYITTEEDDMYLPKLYAVVIGTSDYTGTNLDLKYAAKDAEEFSRTLELAGQELFSPERVNITTLTTDEEFDSWPTKTNISNVFKDLSSNATANDVLVVYLSGHGVNYGGSEGDFYYLTSEAKSGDLKDPAIRESVAISSNELTDYIKWVPTLKQVLILDACHAGQLAEDIMEVKDPRTSSERRALERMKDRTGTFILAGSAADAVSYETSVFGQGLLTYSLLFGMSGPALKDNELVDVMSLFQFASDKVPELAQNIGGVQQPEVRIPKGGDSFDIGIVTSEMKEKINLPSAKPLFVRSNFTSDLTFNDDLRLSESLDNQLRDYSTSKEGIKQVIFIDASRYTNAFSLKGRYIKEADDYKVSVRMFRGDELIDSFELTGKSAEDMSREIIEKVYTIIVQ